MSSKQSWKDKTTNLCTSKIIIMWSNLLSSNLQFFQKKKINKNPYLEHRGREKGELCMSKNRTWIPRTQRKVKARVKGAKAENQVHLLSSLHPLPPTGCAAWVGHFCFQKLDFLIDKRGHNPYSVRLLWRRETVDSKWPACKKVNLKRLFPCDSTYRTRLKWQN